MVSVRWDEDGRVSFNSPLHSFDDDGAMIFLPKVSIVDESPFWMNVRGDQAVLLQDDAAFAPSSPVPRNGDERAHVRFEVPPLVAVGVDQFSPLDMIYPDLRLDVGIAEVVES